MNTCGDCGHYEAEDAEKGRCKCKRAERHVVTVHGSAKDIINGWPKVKASEKACGEFE